MYNAVLSCGFGAQTGNDNNNDNDDDDNNNSNNNNDNNDNNNKSPGRAPLLRTAPWVNRHPQNRSPGEQMSLLLGGTDCLTLLV